VESTGGVYAHSTKTEITQVLLRIVPVTLHGPKRSLHTYALSDEASTVTLMDDETAKIISVEGARDPLNLQWTHNLSQTDDTSRRVSFKISVEDNKCYYLNNVHTIKDLALPAQSCDVSRLRKRWSYLDGYEIPKLQEANPTILIGQDNCHLIIARTVVEEQTNAPVLSLTKLGWILHGNVSLVKRVDSNYTFLSYTRDEMLHAMVKESYTVDNFGVKPPNKPLMGSKENRAMQILEQTTKRVGDRFESGLLWAKEDPYFPNTRTMALHRLKSMEKKMDSDVEFDALYCQKMEDYVAKGYAR